MPVAARIVEGDLIDQDVDAIVNSWNRNLIPWWLLLPSGVSGAIKKRAGTAPFRELGRHGHRPAMDRIRALGAGLGTQCARAGERKGISIDRVPADRRRRRRRAEERVLGWMREELAQASFPGEVRIVRYRVK